MTIKRTREIFGDQIKNLTDDQVNEFISNTGTLCDVLFQDAICQLTSENKNVKNVINN